MFLAALLLFTQLDPLFNSSPPQFKCLICPPRQIFVCFLSYKKLLDIDHVLLARCSAFIKSGQEANLRTVFANVFINIFRISETQQ